MAGDIVQSFANSTVSSVTTITVTVSGATAGNLLTACISVSFPDSAPTATGWIPREDHDGDANSGATFDRIGSGDSNDNFVPSWTTARECAATVDEYSGLDSSSPFEASGEFTTFAAASSRASGDPINSGSATPLTANGIAIAFHMGEDERDANETELTINNSYTESNYEVATGGNNNYAAMAFLVYTTTAAQSPDWDTSRTGAWGAYTALHVYKEPAGVGLTGIRNPMNGPMKLRSPLGRRH